MSAELAEFSKAQGKEIFPVLWGGFQTHPNQFIIIIHAKSEFRDTPSMTFGESITEAISYIENAEVAALHAVNRKRVLGTFY